MQQSELVEDSSDELENENRIRFWCDGTVDKNSRNIDTSWIAYNSNR